MGQPTEQEIFDCLSTNFRLAAENCEKLAVSPRRGQIYRAFIENLKLVEGAARQAGYYRGGDARWLQIGLMVAEAHKRAGDWLRGIKQPGGGYRKIPEGQRHPLFMKLAEVLRSGHRRAEELRAKRVNRMGPILPIMRQATSQRETTPAGWRKTASGLVLPA